VAGGVGLHGGTSRQQRRCVDLRGCSLVRCPCLRQRHAKDDSVWRTRVATPVLESWQCRSRRWWLSVRLEEQSDGKAKRKRRRIAPQRDSYRG
jgi:hypothetical protein